MSLRAAELIAAIGYMVDITPEGNHYHSWRTALVAEKIASHLLPDMRQEAFLSGLLQGAGTQFDPKVVDGMLSLIDSGIKDLEHVVLKRTTAIDRKEQRVMLIMTVVSHHLFWVYGYSKPTKYDTANTLYYCYKSEFISSNNSYSSFFIASKYHSYNCKLNVNEVRYVSICNGE